MAAHLHNTLKLAAGAAGHLLFQLFGSQRPNGNLILFLDILGDAVIKGVARHRQAGGLDPAAHADDGNIGGATANIHDHAAVGLANLQPGPQRGSYRLIHQKYLLGSRRHDGLHNGVRLNAGDGRGHADRNARFEDAGAADLIDEPYDQFVRHAVILDDAIPQRAYQVDMGGRAAHHFQGFVPHCNDGVGAGIHRADGRLAEHNALLLRRNNDGGRPQVDSDVILFHGLFPPSVWRHPSANSAIRCTAYSGAHSPP